MSSLASLPDNAARLTTRDEVVELREKLQQAEMEGQVLLQQLKKSQDQLIREREESARLLAEAVNKYNRQAEVISSLCEENAALHNELVLALREERAAKAQTSKKMTCVSQPSSSSSSTTTSQPFDPYPGFAGIRTPTPLADGIKGPEGISSLSDSCQPMKDVELASAGTSFRSSHCRSSSNTSGMVSSKRTMSPAGLRCTPNPSPSGARPKRSNSMSAKSCSSADHCIDQLLSMPGASNRLCSQLGLASASNSASYVESSRSALPTADVSQGSTDTCTQLPDWSCCMLDDGNVPRKSKDCPLVPQLASREVNGNSRMVQPPITDRICRDLPPPGNFTVTRLVGDDGLLVAWEPPRDRRVAGYRIYVEHEFHSQVRSTERTKALISGIGHLLRSDAVFLVEICSVNNDDGSVSPSAYFHFAVGLTPEDTSQEAQSQ